MSWFFVIFYWPIFLLVIDSKKLCIKLGFLYLYNFSVIEGFLLIHYMLWSNFINGLIWWCQVMSLVTRNKNCIYGCNMNLTLIEWEWEWSESGDRVRTAQKNFHSLLPVLTNSGISLKVRGHAYNTCICSVLLYASETWAIKVDDIHRLVRNDTAMVRWICSAKLCEMPMSDLRTCVGISSIGDVIRYNCLH